MDLWMNLLFGNPIGLLSVLTVVGAMAIMGYLFGMMLWKSGHS